jgi:hypothetical protein
MGCLDGCLYLRPMQTQRTFSVLDIDYDDSGVHEIACGLCLQGRGCGHHPEAGAIGSSRKREASYAEEHRDLLRRYGE